MYHSVRFSCEDPWQSDLTQRNPEYNRDSYDDWHLIPTTRPVINPPPFRSNYISIPGGNGVIDLSEVLAGEPLYDNRTGSMEFAVENGHEDWTSIYHNILNWLHGRYMKCELEDDPGFYYQGRFSINNWKSDKAYSIITIDYNLDPFKYSTQDTDEDWLWDSFNFENGTIFLYKDLVVNGTLTVEVYGTTKRIVPTIISSGSITASSDGITKTLVQGKNRFPEFAINGTNRIPAFSKTFTFTGNGKVSIKARGAYL